MRTCYCVKIFMNFELKYYILFFSAPLNLDEYYLQDTRTFMTIATIATTSHKAVANSNYKKFKIIKNLRL